jgi:predicted acyltransferase
MLMLLVNMPGSWDHVYEQLAHAPWHGLTLADLVFPFFLFSVGVSIPLAVQARQQTGASQRDILQDGLRRTLILFALGVGINLLFKPTLDLDMVRWSGVLQRIALVFAVCFILQLFLSARMIVLIVASLLIFYTWALLQAPMTIEDTRIFAWDRALLPGRLLRGDWDPEGLLSTLPALVNGMLGVLVGHHADKLGRGSVIAGAGAAVMLAGVALNVVIPFNKNLWTSSYVLFTSGFAMIALDVLASLFDKNKIPPSFSLVHAFGRNAIAAYLIHTAWIALVIRKNLTGSNLNALLYEYLAMLSPSPEFASLLCAFIYLGVCSLPILYMYKRNIIWKV